MASGRHAVANVFFLSFFLFFFLSLFLQDATNNAMAECQATMTGCHLLTYACVNSLSLSSPVTHSIGGSAHHRDSSIFPGSQNGIVVSYL